ncbi:GIY-YIG nuclease family protein [Pandoraea sp. ISTKB]|uniref:GIY-YIG nuclease family protein n=1 Tax=Pandoraea sp. ISTKB TaxID=1586708 RepID=UPI00147A1808
MGGALAGATTVYSSTDENGNVRYVGITDDLEARARAHLRQKGIIIEPIAGLQGISREDARSVEQVLIEYYGLGKNSGSLINKINSISSKNQIYADSLKRGVDILKKLNMMILGNDKIRRCFLDRDFEGICIFSVCHQEFPDGGDD